MNRETRRLTIDGPAGQIEAEVDEPGTPPRGVVVLCHPHPQHGGTMTNKVVQTLARAFVQMGYRCVRFNFRGVGASQGAWDEGRGEVDDALAVVAAVREPGLPLALGGFSFGGFIAASAAKAFITRIWSPSPRNDAARSNSCLCWASMPGRPVSMAGDQVAVRRHTQIPGAGAAGIWAVRSVVQFAQGIYHVEKRVTAPAKGVLLER